MEGGSEEVLGRLPALDKQNPLQSKAGLGQRNPPNVVESNLQQPRNKPGHRFRSPTNRSASRSHPAIAGNIRVRLPLPDRVGTRTFLRSPVPQSEPRNAEPGQRETHVCPVPTAPRRQTAAGPVAVHGGHPLAPHIHRRHVAHQSPAGGAAQSGHCGANAQSSPQGAETPAIDNVMGTAH